MMLGRAPPRARARPRSTTSVRAVTSIVRGGRTDALTRAPRQSGARVAAGVV